MEVQQRSTLRQRLIAIIVTGIGGAVATAVSFGMAVYETAHPEAVPVIAAGKPIDTGRWAVTIREAKIDEMPPTGTKPLEPKTFVTVAFDLDNRSAATSNVFSKLLAIDPPVRGLQEPTVYLARDNWIAGGIHPDMPERLVAVWEWPASALPPRELRLLVGGQVYKRRDNLYGASGWFDRDPIAAVELPVAQPPAEVTQ
ncbi:hypothetical protein [Mesorhizobium sp. A623]